MLNTLKNKIFSNRKGDILVTNDRKILQEKKL